MSECHAMAYDGLRLKDSTSSTFAVTVKTPEHQPRHTTVCRPEPTHTAATWKAAVLRTSLQLSILLVAGRAQSGNVSEDLSPSAKTSTSLVRAPSRQRVSATLTAFGRIGIRSQTQRGIEREATVQYVYCPSI